MKFDNEELIKHLELEIDTFKKEIQNAAGEYLNIQEHYENIMEEM